MDTKSKELILVGFAENIKSYRVFDHSKRRVTTSRDVIIYENVEGNSTSNENATVSVGDTIQTEKSDTDVNIDDKEVKEDPVSSPIDLNISSVSDYLNTLTNLDPYLAAIPV